MTDPIDVEALAVEVANSNFGDERLNKRLKSLVSVLAAAPDVSLPRSFDSAGLEGAYRFWSNPRVTQDDILGPHVEATRARCDAESEFLVVHDTTDFSYRFEGSREGLGRAQLTNEKSKQMFFAHFSLAVAADGTRRPLGVVALKTWARGTSRSGTEHLRWETQARLTAERLKNNEKAIHVMDREADDYEMLVALTQGHHRFIVRCQYNRWLDEEPETKVRDVFAGLVSVVARTIEITLRKPHRVKARAKGYPARAPRMATLNVSAARVALKKPETKRKHPTPTVLPPSLTVNMVRVWEPNPPAGEEPVEWILYTTDPIDTAEQQLAVVDHYRARWIIEEYNKAIKTGCNFERRQLQDYESLVNLLATLAPIAYRLLLIRNEARRDPEAPGLSVVSADHLDVLRAKGRLRLSESPTTREVYLAIAALGGHIKYAGDPGWLTLSRGFEKLETLTEGWLAAKLQLRSDQR